MSTSSACRSPPPRAPSPTRSTWTRSTGRRAAARTTSSWSSATRSCSRVCATASPTPPAPRSPRSARSWRAPARGGSTAAGAPWRWRRDSSTSVGDSLVLQLLLLAPIRGVLAGLTTLTVRLLGRGAETQAALSEEELRTLVDVGASEGVVEREEREMIHKVFELEDTLVRSVMVPRTDMFCLDVETPVAEILPALREQLHSRVPVFEGSIDVIVGVLYTKDLLPFVRGLPPDFDLRSKLHPPYFVPESKRADALLQEFQAKKLHIAVVVDEYGGTAGLVALEDLLEELVGEIADEYDEPERLIQKIDARTYRVAGKLSVDDLNAATGLTISNGASDTAARWVLDLFGRVPRRGERVETPELSVTVEKIERTRVVEVLLSLRTPQSTEKAA